MRELGGNSEALKRDIERMAGWRKLDKAETELRNQWWIDGKADPKILDEWLAAKIAMYQYRLHTNMLHPLISGEREQIGEQLLFHQRIAGGSYQREKATYCIDLAKPFQTDADAAEARIQKGISREKDLDLDKRLVSSNRSIAANCLHMAANCLTMPEANQSAPEET